MKEKEKKRKFTQEFKTEAVELAKKIGNVQAGKELGISEAGIRYWRNKLENANAGADLGNPSAKNKSYSELERENRRLEKENGYLREINKVLKKSTAIFSADHMGGLK